MKFARWITASLIAVGLAYAGLHHWRESRLWEETDNAYLDGPVHPIASRLLGTVDEVLVEENSRIKQGQVLIRLDSRDSRIRREQAEAKLTEARATLAAAQTGVNQAKVRSRLNEVALEKARMDLERIKGLANGPRAAVARQEVDHAQAEYDTQKASSAVSIGAIDAASAETVVAQAKETSAAVALKDATLQCEYTTITSPVDGRVGRRNVEKGQPVIPAQPLIALVGDDLWLIANFKETQISSILPGQAARVRFDAFPDQEWPGTVESLSPASGSRFALLPPDNATGNFTRVVQRLPIRIRIGEKAMREFGSRLAPGLSAQVRVRVDPEVIREPARPLPGKLTQR